MAKMIPGILADDTRSDAERDIFDSLRTASGTEDWVVLHSLNLTARDKKPFGEVDFVLLAPGYGVFALEVKGGGVECNEGVWFSTDRTGARWPLKRSPFKQAQEGMWQIRSTLTTRLGTIVMEKVVFGSAAIFPDTRFSPSSPEWASWEVLDKESSKRGLVSSLRSMMDGHCARLKLDGKAFTAAVLSQVRQTLRPDFECTMATGASLKHVEKQLLRLTEEQYHALDLMQFNERMICEGAAGTGKTMLALELARREARQGRRTLLLCYNRLLAAWLADQTKDEPNLTTGSFHQLGRAVIEEQKLLTDFARSAADHGFWNTRFLELAWQAVEQSGLKFDALVVDEAQDLSSSLALEVLDGWVQGGLAGGRWAMFADFQRQAIFTSELNRDLLTARAGQHTRWVLSTNCRNTKRIARETALLSGFERPPYRMGQVDGLPVDTSFTADAQEASAKLAERINKFIASGGQAEDLVVLSPRKLVNSCAAEVQRGYGFLLIDAGEPAPARSRIPIVRFATVQAFKGMESQAVILCDIAALGEAEQQSLLYVGMSRARLQLMILLKSDLRPAYEECRAKQFTAEWK